MCKDLKRLAIGNIPFDTSKTIKVAGFVENIRDHGELVFVDMKNGLDILQLVFNNSLSDFEEIKNLKPGSTIKACGDIILRSHDRINKNIKSGKYELVIAEFIIVSKALPLPIDSNTLNENKILEYRNIHLRNDKYHKILKLKSDISASMRITLSSQDFMDIETPLLTRATPGGAKDFLALSSQKEKHVFGLAQSPQLFKQLLMTSGFEKYYQIAKCFRDEELRSDRQPEFLQLDLEMSWVNQIDIMDITSQLVYDIESNVLNNELEDIETKTYKEVMNKYCSDKPDLRYNLEFHNLNNILKNTEFQVFKDIINKGGVIKSIAIPTRLYSKKQRRDIEKLAISNGASGLGYLMYKEDELISPLSKFMSATDIENIKKETVYTDTEEYNIRGNKIIYFIADIDIKKVNKIGDALRRKFAEDLELLSDRRKYLWVIDFPLFEKKEDGSIGAMHHPFTKPNMKDYEDYQKGKLSKFEIKTQSYDLVLNGSEIGGGSERIDSEELQNEIFDLLEFDEENKSSLEWFTKLFKYGVPEHAGIALGVDRYVQKILNLKSIKESIPFPKNSYSECKLTFAPSEISKKEIKEYGFRKIENNNGSAGVSQNNGIIMEDNNGTINFK